jgi:DNA-binding transcriptional MerR regulator
MKETLMSIKSPEAFRTISEVSKDLSLPQHVLRFWETKFSQIKPIKRGGGRRYYRPEDVDLLKGIKSLLYNDGYTIRGVQKVIKENGTKKILLKNDNLITKAFTEFKNNSNDEQLSESSQHYSISDIKRKKLMGVLDNLISLKKNIKQY